MDLYAGSQFGFSPQSTRTMKSIFEKLQVMEIPPDGNTRDGKLDAKISHDLTERLIRRAEELRKSWAKGNGDTARSLSRVSSAVSA